MKKKNGGKYTRITIKKRNKYLQKCDGKKI